MYCPNVRITPFGPAPYLMILTEPSVVLEGLFAAVNYGRHTKYKTNDDTHSWKHVSKCMGR
jgi:hypothetical protein